MTEKLIRRREVEEITGLSRSAIYDQMERRLFPRPLRIGARAVAWRKQDVLDWISTRNVA